LGYLQGIDGLESSYSRNRSVTRHSLPNYELCHETSDSESRVAKNIFLAQKRAGATSAHARAAFASETIDSLSYPFAMLYHIELA
jgi:hypothetical protein